MIIFVIIGALIGAGFASGQEIYLFFYRFGLKGIWGLLLCSILIGAVIYKTLLIIYEHNIKNYEEFLVTIFKNRKLAKILNWTINIFLLGTFFIMVSGFGAYFEQEYGTTHLVGSAILAIICFIVLLKNISGVAKINTLVVPILIVCILIISFNNIVFNIDSVEFYEIAGSSVRNEHVMVTTKYFIL